MAEKIFSVAGRNEVARHWTAARRGTGLRGLLRGACAWMDVPGRVWMDAMEVVGG